jgi:hypothetical protein
MRRQVVLLLASAVALGFHTEAKAGDREELTWGELSSLNGRTIRMTMPEMAVITGRLTAVEPQGLVLQISKTTDKRSYPKGRFVVPRAEVKVLAVLCKRKRGKVIGTICGAWLGLTVGIFAAIPANSAGAALATLAGVGGGITTLGYYLGDAADRRTTTVVIRQ